MSHIVRGMLVILSFSWFAAVSAAVLSAQSIVPEGQLLFGWAQESIVPNRPVAIGGQYETRISGHVHDPLTVTALVMETREQGRSLEQVVWVSCDLVGIRKQSVDRVRERIARELPELDPRKIIISATHTHTAPALTDTEESDLHPYDFARSWAYRIPDGGQNVMRPLEYAAFMEDQIGSAIVRAWKSRAPGELGHALSHVSVARNRRAVFFDGTTRMYGDTRDPMFSHPEGASDDSLDVIFFWREGKLVGLAVTIYCPSQVVEGESSLSADFWHDTRRMLREQHSSELFVLPLCGASGDQSPHIQVGRLAEEKMLEQRRTSYRQEIARRIVRSIEEVTDLAYATRRTYVRLGHRVEEIALPVWLVPESRFRESSANVNRGNDQLERLTAPEYIRWRVDRTMVARYELQKTDPLYRTELHAVRLDDLALVTNPFELFTDYGLRMKARSPAAQTSVVQLTADCPAYLATERAILGGGYSARIDDGVVGPPGGRQLVEETTRILNELWLKE
jgi:hypothetical protein